MSNTAVNRLVLVNLYETLKPIALKLNDDAVRTKDNEILSASIILSATMGALALYLSESNDNSLLEFMAFMLGKLLHEWPTKDDVQKN